MAFRIRPVASEGIAGLDFEGRLDWSALEYLRRYGEERLNCQPVPVRLRAGTEIDAECLGELARLPGVQLSAESPYLALWLRRLGVRGV